MVGKVKKWLGIDVLEKENLRLAKALHIHSGRIDDLEKLYAESNDHEARIAFCESRLTPKQSEAKIVPKAHKRTFRQFAEAASKATEEIAE